MAGIYFKKKDKIDLYIEELDWHLGTIEYELSVAPAANILVGIDTPDDLTLGLDALWLEVLMKPNLRATAIGDVNISCVRLYDLDLHIEPKAEFLFEAIIPFKDYEHDEYIETELGSHRYYSLQALCPEGVVSLSDIEFTLHLQAKVDLCILGTYTLDTDLDYTWDIGFEQPWSLDMLVPHSPVNIHIYDLEGRHAGPNRSGGIDNEIPNLFYKEEDGESYIQIFSTVDEFTVEVEGTDTGEYGLELRWPLMVYDSTGKIITSIDWKLERVSTFFGDKDFFHFDFRTIQEMVQSKVDAGKSIDESISEVLESLDADNDGIPDIQDLNMVYQKRFTSLFVKDTKSSAGESIFLEATLFDQEQPLTAKTIAFYLDGKFVGNTVAGPDGIAQLTYNLPNDFTEGIHELTAVFEEDLIYAGCTGTAMLKCMPSLPQVTLTNPDNSAPLKGTVGVNGTLSDSNLFNVKLLIDGNEVSTALPYSWDTTAYPDGPHTLVLKATDATNLQDEASMFVIIDNTLPAIFNVSANATENNATIKWDTNELCDSTVFLTRDFVNWVEVTQQESTIQHSVLIKNLSPGTYYFRVQSRDWGNNVTQDDNGGGYHKFTIVEMDDGDRPTYKEYEPLVKKNIQDAESLKEDALSLLKEAADKGLDVLEAQALIEKADALLADAKEHYISRNYIAANNFVLEAINLYQQAIDILLDLLS